MSPRRRFGGATTKFRKGTTTDQLAGLVNHVEIEERFQFSALADLIDGALGGGAREEGHEIRSHDPADASFRITNQLTDFSPPLWIQKRDNSFPPLVGKAVDESHGVVRVGPDNHPAELVVVDQRQDVGEQFGRELFEGFVGAARREEDIEKPPDLRWL